MVEVKYVLWAHASLSAEHERERAAAVVEFTLVSVVLVGLFLAVVQVGLALRVRNTLVACAAEGARYAANADRDLSDGEVRTAALIAQSLSECYGRAVAARYVYSGGMQFVYGACLTAIRRALRSAPPATQSGGSPSCGGKGRQIAPSTRKAHRRTSHDRPPGARA